MLEYPALPTWEPPYENHEVEYQAQLRWLDAYPDQIPPWARTEDPDVVTSCNDPRPPRPPRPPTYEPRPTRSEEAIDRAMANVRAEPEKPAEPPPPPPPWPEGLEVGTRVRVLVSEVDSYGRGVTRDGVVRGWDGGLIVQLDGLLGVRRFHASRISAFHPYWTEMLLNPERVCWVRGDRPPLLPPDEVLRPAPRDSSAAPVKPPPPVDDAFPKDAGPSPAPTMPNRRRYPGFYVE